MSSIPWGNSGINGVRGSSYPVGIKRKQMAKEAGITFFFFRKKKCRGLPIFIVVIV